MAYNNIYDWHDSVRKRWEQEQDQHRLETMSGWMDRVDREAYSQEFVDIYQKWAQKHKEELKTIWDAPKNPANEAWERQSKIKRDPNDDLRKKWRYGFKFNREDWLKKHMEDWEDWLKDIEGAKEDCGRKFPRKYGNNTDPNDITDLCKVEVLE